MARASYVVSVPAMAQNARHWPSFAPPCGRLLNRR